MGHKKNEGKDREMDIPKDGIGCWKIPGESRNTGKYDKSIYTKKILGRGGGNLTEE